MRSLTSTSKINNDKRMYLVVYFVKVSANTRYYILEAQTRDQTLQTMIHEQCRLLLIESELATRELFPDYSDYYGYYGDENSARA